MSDEKNLRNEEILHKYQCLVIKVSRYQSLGEQTSEKYKELCDELNLLHIELIKRLEVCSLAKIFVQRVSDHV